VKSWAIVMVSWLCSVFFLRYPLFCDGVVGFDANKNYFGWKLNGIGRYLTAMACQFLGFTILLLLKESSLFHNIVDAILRLAHIRGLHRTADDIAMEGLILCNTLF